MRHGRAVGVLRYKDPILTDEEFPPMAGTSVRRLYRSESHWRTTGIEAKAASRIYFVADSLREIGLAATSLRRSGVRSDRLQAVSAFSNRPERQLLQTEHSGPLSRNAPPFPRKKPVIAAASLIFTPMTANQHRPRIISSTNPNRLVFGTSHWGTPPVVELPTSSFIRRNSPRARAGVHGPLPGLSGDRWLDPHGTAAATISARRPLRAGTEAGNTSPHEDPDDSASV